MSGPVDVRERRLVETFVTLADSLVDDFDLADLLHTLTERAVEFTGADEAGILLVDDTGALQCLASSRERTHMLELFQIQSQQGPCRDCYVTGRAVWSDDLEADRDRWPLLAPRAVAVGFRSVQAVPLSLRGRTLGALNLFSSATGGIGDGGRSVAQAMADVATIAILQQRGLHHAQRVAEGLREALSSRVAIEQAKGVIAEQTGLGMDDAFDLIRSYARDNNLTLGRVVAEIVARRWSVEDLRR